MWGAQTFISTMDTEWVKEYNSKNYMIFDPTIIWSTANGDDMIRWSEIQKSRLKYIDTRRVFEKAKKYQLNYGSVTNYYSGKTKNFMSLARDDREVSDIELNTTKIIFAQICDEYLKTAVLTEAELKTLRMLAEGFSQNETAEKLCVTLSAIKQRLRSIVNKLDAKNSAHALVIATSKGLI
ncbi:MAG: autoinducer binding domain-containing protein [Pseudomonadota bacterium]